MTSTFSNYDFSKIWTRVVGTNGERMVTSIALLYRNTEGGGYKAVANLAYLRDNFRTLNISQSVWLTWIDQKIVSPPKAVIVKGNDEMHGWVLLNEETTSLISRLTVNGTFDEDTANEVLMDWEDKAFEAQWQQFHKILPSHILFPFNQLSEAKRYQLTWDAYVYAKRQLRADLVTTFTKAVIPVHLLQMEWLRYAKARFPYTKRGPIPRIAHA